MRELGLKLKNTNQIASSVAISCRVMLATFLESDENFIKHSPPQTQSVAGSGVSASPW